MASIQSHFFFLLALAFLALHHDQNELVIWSYQNLVIGGLQPHELQVVVGVQVTYRVLSL
jgi:hypothetical protein